MSAVRKWYASGLRSRLAPGPTGKQRELVRAEVLAWSRRREPQAPPRTGPVAEAVAMVPVTAWEAMRLHYLLAQEKAGAAEVRAVTAEWKLERAMEREAALTAERDQARAETERLRSRRWWHR